LHDIKYSILKKAFKIYGEDMRKFLALIAIVIFTICIIGCSPEAEPDCDNCPSQTCPVK